MKSYMTFIQSNRCIERKIALLTITVFILAHDSFNLNINAITYRNILILSQSEVIHTVEGSSLSRALDLLSRALD